MAPVSSGVRFRRGHFPLKSGPMIAEQTNTLSVDRLNQPVLEQARREFAWISANHTVGQALAHVQQSRVSDRIVYFYVLDDQRRLVGVVPTRGLLLNVAATPISEIMIRRVVKLPVEATLLDACEMFMLHRLLALPVVDDQGRMLAVLDVGVYTDEIIDMADRELSADVFQLIGVHLAQVRKAPLWTVFALRFPWLLCSVGGGLACAMLAGVYRVVLQQVLSLALFIPVVLALAESLSMQSLTLGLQLQPRGRGRWAGVIGGLLREIPLGILLGVATAIPVALVAWGWQRNGRLVLCMAITIVLSAATSALFGRLVPALLRAVQRDPKVASGPITLALSDVATLFLLLSLARWLLVVR